MDVQQVIEKQHELEIKLRGLLNEFEDETGVLVDSIRFVRATTFVKRNGTIMSVETELKIA